MLQAMTNYLVLLCILMMLAIGVGMAIHKGWLR